MWHGTYEHRCPYAGNLRRACGGRTDGVRTSKTAILSLCGIQWWKARLFIGFKHAYRFRYSEYFQSIIDHIDAYRYFKFIYNIAYIVHNTVNTKPNWYRYIDKMCTKMISIDTDFPIFPDISIYWNIGWTDKEAWSTASPVPFRVQNCGVTRRCPSRKLPIQQQRPRLKTRTRSDHQSV